MDQIQIELKEYPAVVRFYRKKSGLSQKELADLAGVGKTVVFDIEKGKKTIQLDTLLRLFSILNIGVVMNGKLMMSYARSRNEKG
ncbi:MAG: hypothetical protein A2583_02090 [Bdellovibrionales bacterium RIFOXYD1_FULL_53_11]|nr:MAG: hypothetical protein A2583_02090 [Bdellovibrionales bacterium RIFOXYD1_FULL_53_11]